MAFNQTYEEALEKARSKPQKPRKPLARGKALGQGNGSSGSLGRKNTLKTASTAGGKKIKKAKRPKKKTDGQLKKLVWKQFSIFIRTREADADGFITCTTCPARSFWRSMQAGHFVRGRLNANLFDPRGCAVQCVRCNIHLQGNVVVYYGWMRANYGQNVIDELIAQNDVTHKWAPGELAGLLVHYKALNAANPLVQETQ